MNTRTCSKCGWVYPATYKANTCKFCHAPLIGRYCSSCGEYFPDLKFPRCTACDTKRFADMMARRRILVATQLREWQDIIATIPTPYVTLKEEAWINACKHFGGCAFCGKPDIDARAMFIPFRMGGRYCAWNIVPACEPCTEVLQKLENPFERMDNLLRRNGNRIKLGQSKEHLDQIVDYLRPILLEAANEKRGEN